MSMYSLKGWKDEQGRFKAGNPWGKKATGRSPSKFFITYKDLADLFEANTRTIGRWVSTGRLSLNLKDIIHKYNNRHLLDRRRKERSAPDHHPPETHEL